MFLFDDGNENELVSILWIYCNDNSNNIDVMKNAVLVYPNLDNSKNMSKKYNK